jgi:hypothetical protein
VRESQRKLETVQAELAEAKKAVIETNDQAILQDVGIYQIHHPLENALAYKVALDKIKNERKELIREKRAVSHSSTWTVNNSKREGSKMTNGIAKLMLEAYNAASENTLRTMRPYTVDRGIERLTKTRDKVAQYGAVLGIEISAAYHALAIRELELTADYMVVKEEEKERAREERAAQREEEAALREYQREKDKLRKEREHYRATIARLSGDGNHEQVEELKAKLVELDASIQGIEEREANVRAGYVYVISNLGAFGPDMVKVGLTRRLDPTERVAELGDASVPFRFDTHALIFSSDAVSLEAALHNRLADRRVNLVNSRREFFYATPQEVRAIIEEMGNDYLVEYVEQPEAWEWFESGGPKRRGSA